MKTILRVILSGPPFHGIAVEVAARSNKGLSFLLYRVLYLVALRHWLSGAAGLKVRRFNFYSRQYNICLCRRDSTDSPNKSHSMPFRKALFRNFYRVSRSSIYMYIPRAFHLLVSPLAPAARTSTFALINLRNCQ